MHFTGEAMMPHEVRINRTWWADGARKRLARGQARCDHASASQLEIQLPRRSAEEAKQSHNRARDSPVSVFLRTYM